MCDERRAGLERPHYITNVPKAGGRTVHWKIALIACTIGANRVFSNLLQTKKIENRDLSINRQSPSAAESSQTKSVCTPLCNTMYNSVATPVRPLPGLLDHRMFAWVKEISGGVRSVIPGRRSTTPAKYGRVSARGGMHGLCGRGTRRRECGDPRRSDHS